MSDDKIFILVYQDETTLTVTDIEFEYQADYYTHVNGCFFRTKHEAVSYGHKMAEGLGRVFKEGSND